MGPGQEREGREREREGGGKEVVLAVSDGRGVHAYIRVRMWRGGVQIPPAAPAVVHQWPWPSWCGCEEALAF